MASDDETQNLHNRIAELERALEGWQRLGRVLGDIFRRVGSGRLSAEDAAVLIQAALEGRLTVVPPDTATDGNHERNQRIADVQRAMERGDLASAIKMYAALAQGCPDDTRFLLKLGECYARTGDTANATTTYLTVAQQYERHGFYLKAVAAYKQILKLNEWPTDDAQRSVRTANDVRLALAALYERLGLLVDAHLQCQEFLAHAEAGDGRIPDVHQAIQRLEVRADTAPEQPARS